mmetsp:Transcript_56674/g.175729  ORF Transcript_56674/g.175729 Transcript_56674/m.175729 type:complete len:193 (-) Transcript_56674:70-648(-)
MAPEPPAPGEPVKRFDAASPEIAVEARQLLVRLAGHVEPGTSYSLQLSPGSVTDVAMNEGQGLTVGQYIFSVETTILVQEKSSMATWLIVVIACVPSVLLLLGCVALCILSTRVKQARQAVSSRLSRRSYLGSSQGIQSWSWRVSNFALGDGSRSSGLFGRRSMQSTSYHVRVHNASSPVGDSRQPGSTQNK